jgi:sulfate transporter 4
MSQIRFIFGYSVPRSEVIYEIIHNIIAGIDQFNWKTFVMGVASITALASLKSIGKHYPKLKWVRAIGPLAVTAVTIVLTVVFSLDDKGIPVVGSIPKGLPQFSAGEWTPIQNFEKLYVVVLSIAIVGFMESVAIAKQLASKHKYEIDPSQELIGLGMANFLGGMFQAYPITGSFSRSAVNNESGAESGIAGMITATLVGLVLLLLTPVFEKLPLNVLAAIVISGVLGLLDYTEAIYLWRVHKFDFRLTAFWDQFLRGWIGHAVGVSPTGFTNRRTRTPCRAVYRAPRCRKYTHPETKGMIALSWYDAPIYFANVQNVRDKIRKYRLAAAAELVERGGDVKYIILEMAPVSHIDTSALHILGKFYDGFFSSVLTLDNQLNLTMLWRS